nr:MAG TPA: hypothetical protein [Bacteriophage sp.]
MKRLTSHPADESHFLPDNDRATIVFICVQDTIFHRTPLLAFVIY